MCLELSTVQLKMSFNGHTVINPRKPIKIDIYLLLHAYYLLHHRISFIHSKSREYGQLTDWPLVMKYHMLDRPDPQLDLSTCWQHNVFQTNKAGPSTSKDTNSTMCIISDLLLSDLIGTTLSVYRARFNV